jgi:hydroxymethylpyrimidine pyrophosphatase-like HAD family hydrolase
VAKVSSIHVNGWWGQFTKEQGLRELLEKHYGTSLEKDLIYTGDSPNDGPLFKVAGMSVGVANIRHFIGKSEFHLPQFVTQKEGGSGSVELIERCLLR